MQLSRLQADYDSLEARATEQIQAALNDGAAAAQSAREQVPGSVTCQSALRQGLQGLVVLRLTWKSDNAVRSPCSGRDSLSMKHSQSVASETAHLDSF